MGASSKLSAEVEGKIGDQANQPSSFVFYNTSRGWPGLTEQNHVPLALCWLVCNYNNNGCMWKMCTWQHSPASATGTTLLSIRIWATTPEWLFKPFPICIVCVTLAVRILTVYALHLAQAEFLPIIYSRKCYVWEQEGCQYLEHHVPRAGFLPPWWSYQHLWSSVFENACPLPCVGPWILDFLGLWSWECMGPYHAYIAVCLATLGILF